MQVLERTLWSALAVAGASLTSATAQEHVPRDVARSIALPSVSVEALDAWRTHVRPSSEESIPWIPTFAEGIRASAAEGKPLLFWAMNGHPLGCT